MAQIKAPPRIGVTIDRFFRLRGKRLKLEKDADKIKFEESLVKDKLIEIMSKADIDSARGAAGTVSITRPIVGKVDDWPKLYEYIRKNNAFELLSPRLHQSNFDERLANSPKLEKTGIPGVERIAVVKFYATAKRGK